MHAPELLANPYIQAIGVGASIDGPGEAAVLLIVSPGEKPAPLPAELDGVRTRVVVADASAPRGIFELATGMSLAPAPDSFPVSNLTKAELERAKLVHTAQVNNLMKQPGVQGVGITSSADAPGEAALMIYLVRGQLHNPIPAVIDGLRTRVRESSRFTAGGWGQGKIPGCRLPETKNGTTTGGQH
jgi:hypothetical protein